MNEKPILFNGDMVRAILDGRKTQTRRPIKPQPRNGYVMPQSRGVDNWAYKFEPSGERPSHGHLVPLKSPFGQPGGQLWVRETMHSDGDDWWFPAVGGDFSFPELDDGFEYADEVCQWMDRQRESNRRRVPSIHMPRWASRITLKVKRVWVERVQEISEEDAVEEGIFVDEHCLIGASGAGGSHREILGTRAFTPDGQDYECATDAFEALWNSIYGNWDADPWVWACEFERAK